MNTIYFACTVICTTLCVYVDCKTNVASARCITHKIVTHYINPSDSESHMKCVEDRKPLIVLYFAFQLYIIRPYNNCNQSINQFIPLQQSLSPRSPPWTSGHFLPSVWLNCRHETVSDSLQFHSWSTLKVLIISIKRGMTEGGCVVRILNHLALNNM